MRIYLLAILTFVLFLSTQIGAPTLPRLSAELGAGEQETALILSAALMTLVALQFISGSLADRFGRRAVLIGGAALGGATSLLCALAPQWQSLLALRVLGGAADAIAMPALLGLTAEMAEGRQGTFLGCCVAARDYPSSSRRASADGYRCIRCALRLSWMDWHPSRLALFCLLS